MNTLSPAAELAEILTVLLQPDMDVEESQRGISTSSPSYSSASMPQPVLH